MSEEMPDQHTPAEMPEQNIPPPVLPSEAIPPVIRPEPAPPEPRGPWGVWATLGIAVLAVLVVQLIVGILLAVTYVIIESIRNPGLNPETLAGGFASNAWIVILSTILSTPITIGIVILFIKARKGPSVTEYLALYKPAGRVLAGWLGVQLVFMVASDLLTNFTGRPIVPDFVLDTLRNTSVLPLVLISLVIMAPLGEEIVFRGFMITGFQPRLGPWGAIALSSLLWAVMHIQYDWYGIVTIFVLGLLYGYVRIYSRSLYITIAMHALMNLGATLEGLYFLYWK